VKNFRLLLVAVVLVIVALVLKQSNEPAITTDPLIGQELVDANDIDQVKELTIKSAQGTIRLNRENGHWRLPDFHDLKADKNRIEELFQRLNQTKIMELVSTNTQRHADLGVASVAADARILNAESANIVLKKDQTTKIKEIYLGKGRQARMVDGSRGFGNAGQYFRYGESDAVYLLSDFLWLEKNQKNWVNKELLKLPAEKIKKIAWNYTGEKDSRFTLERNQASESLALSELDPEMQTRKTSADAAARFCQNLGFDEFIATDSPKLHPALKDGLELAVESFDGLSLNMLISSGPVDLPGMGKMQVAWLSAKYDGSDKELAEISHELSRNSEKFVYALRENRLQAVMIKKEDLTETKPARNEANASDSASLEGLEQVAASHILIAYKGAERSKAERSEEEAQKLAEDILAKIKKGEDFGRLAEENSDCPSGKSDKGSLGDFKRGVMAKEFEDTAFKLKVGEISGLVKTPFGYHIIRRDK
jgi:peptidyl-prolyl cis-trans isomerase C/peptidyl-prolyl cis-trans isomerase SurA